MLKSAISFVSLSLSSCRERGLRLLTSINEPSALRLLSCTSGLTACGLRRGCGSCKQKPKSSAQDGAEIRFANHGMVRVGLVLASNQM